MSKFFVSTVGINQEFLVEKGFRDKGLDHYCPKGRKVVRHARKQMERIFPVISRYVFVRMETAEDFQAIRSTDGVINILSNNGQPVSVPDVEIEELKKRELAGEFNIKPNEKRKAPRWSKSFDVLKNLLSPDAEIQI